MYYVRRLSMKWAAPLLESQMSWHQTAYGLAPRDSPDAFCVHDEVETREDSTHMHNAPTTLNETCTGTFLDPGGSYEDGFTKWFDFGEGTQNGTLIL